MTYANRLLVVNWPTVGATVDYKQKKSNCRQTFGKHLYIYILWTSRLESLLQKFHSHFIEMRQQTC